MGNFRAKRKKNPVVCDYKDRKYYFPQLDRCDRCDKCLPGEGYSLNEPSTGIVFDKDHGALSCLPCVPCPNGYYNDKRSYKCRSCKNCAKQGRVTITTCTATSNAECGDVLPMTRQRRIDTTSQSRTKGPEAFQQTTSVSDFQSTSVQKPVGAHSIAVFSVLFVLVLVSICGTIFYYYRRKKLRSKDNYPVRYMNNKVQKNSRNPEGSALLTKSPNTGAASGSERYKNSQTSESSTADSDETRVKLSGPLNNRNSTSSQTTEKTQPVSMPTTTSSLPASSHSENLQNNEQSPNMFPKLSIFNNSLENCHHQQSNHAWEGKYKSIGYKNFNYLNSIPPPNAGGPSPESMKDLSEFSFDLGSRSPTAEIP